MGLIKICPVCRERNPFDEPLCLKCHNGDLSCVSPVDESEIDKEDCDNSKKVKICPSCKENNPGNALACGNCSWGLEDVKPIDSEESPVMEAAGQCLVLKLSGGRRILVQDGDVVGRHKVGGDILDVGYKTVSKVHARFTREEGRWFIEDLGTTNGTYINNARIQANTLMEIRAGQKLSLSKSCEMVVDKIMKE